MAVPVVGDGVIPGAPDRVDYAVDRGISGVMHDRGPPRDQIHRCVGDAADSQQPFFETMNTARTVHPPDVDCGFHHLQPSVTAWIEPLIYLLAKGVSDLNEPPLALNAFQQHIHNRYYKADSTRGTPATFMWFIEEVGELATALHKVAGDHSDEGPQRANLEEEFADVLAWLCTLANINRVDLADAVRKKYLVGPGPEGHK